MHTPFAKQDSHVDRPANTWPILPRATIIGLGLTLVAPLVYGFLAPVFLQPAVSAIAYSLIGLLFDWLIVFGVLLIVVRWERQPLASIGFRWLSRRLALLGLVLGVVLGLSVPLLGLLAGYLFPLTQTGDPHTTFAQSPAWLVLLGVVTAGITEEVIFRAYPLSRLQRLTGRTWPGVAISLTVFVLLHLGGWNLAHVFGVVLPLGAILSGLYLWRRNLPFVMLTHLVIDFPLFLIAIGMLPPLS